MDKQKKLLINTQLAESAERYEDMADFISDFVKNADTVLDDTQRNYLSVAFKNKIGARRSSWRIASNEEQRKDKDSDKTMLQTYRNEIECELTKISGEIIQLIDQNLIPKVDEHDWGIKTSEKSEHLVFYYKMKADYFRYRAEIYTPNSTDKNEAAKSSEDAYGKAVEAATEMEPTHPIKLGLFLNQSVFYYEIMNDPEKACKIAKQAFDDAIAELDQLKEESYKDSTLIMQLLRDNLTLWTTDKSNDDDEGEK